MHTFVQSYRPITVLTFRWTHLFVGYNPFYFHLTFVLANAQSAKRLRDLIDYRSPIHFRNVLLGAYASVVLQRCLLVLFRGLEGGRLMAFGAALLFASHPVHTEAIAGVVVWHVRGGVGPM